MGLRDHLRAMTVGRPCDFGGVIVEIEGQKFEVRKPSLRERDQIIKESGMQGAKGKHDVDTSMLQVTCVIALTYVPGTDEKVFELADMDTLLNQPAGGWIDDLATACMKSLGVEASAGSEAKNE